ncbi:Rpn family recombination-promoting nuclease/putative transposase, partial [Wolbachia endosymbiont of Bemisia tabaci]|uniref:Rpn family recombination-promoting nuclease/putative transposase n=1 Tax=Wolbachia endosymbiont of Bemisia tabaci TaxID=215173 RepID=UPI00131F28A9
SKVEQLETTVERWSFIFKYAEETTDEDLRKIAEKSPIIKLAYDELNKFHWNEKDLVAYEERIMDLQKEAAILEQKLDDATHKGRQEGIQIGHQKGKIEGKIEVAKNSLKAGVSIDVIAEITGLSVDEIKQLQE